MTMQAIREIFYNLHLSQSFKNYNSKKNKQADRIKNYVYKTYKSAYNKIRKQDSRKIVNGGDD